VIPRNPVFTTSGLSGGFALTLCGGVLGVKRCAVLFALEEHYRHAIGVIPAKYQRTACQNRPAKRSLHFPFGQSFHQRGAGYSFRP
jgi:hypothetical protein